MINTLLLFVIFAILFYVHLWDGFKMFLRSIRNPYTVWRQRKRVKRWNTAKQIFDRQRDAILDINKVEWNQIPPAYVVEQIEKVLNRVEKEYKVKLYSR